MADHLISHFSKNIVEYSTASNSPVIRPVAETTKVRIVFDASTKDFYSLSLNDFLDKGSSSIPRIPILLQFHKIGILADTGKAFLQIRIDPTDRDALRFCG